MAKRKEWIININGYLNIIFKSDIPEFLEKTKHKGNILNHF